MGSTRINSNTLKSVLLGMGLAASTHVSANSVTYYLDTPNVGWLSSGNYATVTIEDVAGNDIQFTVDALDSAFVKGTNFGIQTFGFNINQTFLDNNGLTTTDIANATTVQGAEGIFWSTSTDTNADGFGNFRVVTSDSGSHRLDPLVFTISVAGDTINDYVESNGKSWFAAHIADFTNEPNCGDINGCTSAWFGGGGGPSVPPQSVVPVPAAVWLFGSGLLGLIGVARHRAS